GQMIKLSLLVFDQLDPFDEAGALLCHRQYEVQFVICNRSLLFEIYPNQSSQPILNGKGYVQHHADAFIACLLRVFHPGGGGPDVGDDDNLVEFARIGQQFFGGHRTLMKIAFAHAVYGAHLEPVGFLVEYPKKCTFGVQNFGGFGDHHLQHFFYTGTEVYRSNDISKDLKIVFKLRWCSLKILFFAYDRQDSTVVSLLLNG
ncbi:MAG: hypothetical protein ACE5HX_17870, partial [bacterium]